MASPDAASVQTVKIKVLYTFDVDSKDNHLTRWPQSVQVNTCFVDSVNQIGAIDLRTCLEAVTTASPELLSQTDTDYAIYAYDYSEEDTPLVGQGMLSKHMMEAMGQDTEAMVTGRVTKALMGLLSKNAQPTLEVKLRLKPVGTSMNRQRSGSISSQDGRPLWLQNPEAALQRSASPMDVVGLENMQRMLSEGGLPQNRNDMYAYSRPGSRAGTPGLQPPYDQPQHQVIEEYPRPDSRAAVRQPSHNRRDSFSGYYSADEMIDDGPARKRAKTTKVSQLSKDNFNIEQQSQDLRAMAGKANSLRLHRPTPVLPSAVQSNVFSNEEPVRPPTPVPTKTGRPRGRPRNPRKGEKAMPVTINAAAQARDIVAAQQAAARLEVPETRFMSPEDVRARSVSSTPANIPSSPPIMPSMAARTSPTLPPMRDADDSGFGSVNLDDDIFGENGLVHFDAFDFKAGDVPPDVEFEQFADKHFPPVFDNVEDSPMQHDTSLNGGQAAVQGQPKPATSWTDSLPPPRTIERSQSFTPAARIGMSSPKLTAAALGQVSHGNNQQEPKESRQSGESTELKEPKEKKDMKGTKKRSMPGVAASDPVGPSLQRSQTWAPGSDAPMSEALADPDDVGGLKARSKKKVGKEQTKARLENAIASGDMPPYCDNCGAIETPAWRRGFVKVFDTPYGDIQTGLGPGEIVYKHPLDHNDDGSIQTWRGYKVDRTPQDEADGWTQICLCNPCGLWFHKQKCPRPKEKWAKVSKGRRRRGKSAPKPQMRTNGPLLPRSDAPTPASDDSSPADTSTEAPDGDENDEDMQGMEDDFVDSSEPHLPPLPRGTRASSLGPTAQGLPRGAMTALSQRQVQSSPTKGADNQVGQADADLTPKPVRRQLFPSPNKSLSAPASTHGSSQSFKPTLLPSFVRRSPRLTKTRDVFQVPGVAGAVAITADGKENLMPEVLLEHSSMSIEDLFDINMTEPIMPPATPQRRSERLSSKTPQQRTFGNNVSANVQRSPGFRTPKAKQAPNPVVTALQGSMVKDVAVADMTPFSRNIHEAWHATYPAETLTPGRLHKGVKKSTPVKNVAFDFPDLPSLQGSSPSSNNDPLFSNVNFSELPTDIATDMFSTDAPMPSSPPNFYQLMDPNAQHDPSLDDWGQLQEQHGVKSSYPDPTELGDNMTGMTPRRSPRNRA